MKIIGKIDPILKIRIDNIQQQIDYILDTYSIYGNMGQDVREILNALFAHKEMLVDKI